MKFNKLFLAGTLSIFIIPAIFAMKPNTRAHDKAFDEEKTYNEAPRPAKRHRTDFTKTQQNANETSATQGTLDPANLTLPTGDDFTNCSKSRKRQQKKHFEALPEDVQLPRAKRQRRGRSRTRKIVAASTPEAANASQNTFLSQLHKEHERRRIELKSRREHEEFIEMDAAEVEEINEQRKTIAFNAKLKQLHEERKHRTEAEQEEELCKMLENFHLNPEKPE